MFSPAFVFVALSAIPAFAAQANAEGFSRADPPDWVDLRDTLASETYRRETRLDVGIIDGTLTVVLQILALRVGDILDSALILPGRTAVEGAPMGDTGRLEFGEPVSLERLVVHWPQGVLIHEWRAVNLPPVQIEHNTPFDVDVRAKARISSAADWGMATGTLSPYDLADCPLTPEWQTRLDAIRNTRAADADRATAALRAVQDDLRYVSLSVGAGRHHARLPQVVIASGFGDFKDKALL